MVTKPITLKTTVQHLLDELEQTRCGCSPSDIASGHRTDCNWPAVQEAMGWVEEKMDAEAP